MNFKDFILKERTLYHGTVLDNLNSIKNIGLVGGEPDGKNFVNHVYDADARDIPVFMADKYNLHSSINAMRFHIGVKLNKSMWDVTDNDIRNHGLLVIVKDKDINIAGYGYDSDYYRGVEPKDYISDGETGDIFLYGNKLIDFLNKKLISSRRKPVIPDKKYEKKLKGWFPNKNIPSLFTGEI